MPRADRVTQNSKITPAELRELAKQFDLRKLTESQKHVFAFIVQTFRRRTSAPTIKEIGAYFGLKYTNAVMTHLKYLETKGVIRREDGRITVVGLTVVPEATITLRDVVHGTGNE